jgi:hypothetical protein
VVDDKPPLSLDLAQLEQLGSSREIFARRWVNRIKHLHSGKG